jgi:hypothetical protein
MTCLLPWHYCGLEYRHTPSIIRLRPAYSTPITAARIFAHCAMPSHKSSLTPQQSATGFAHRDCAAICSLACHARLFQDFSILLRFSLLFKRSTRLLCIFSSIFANRSRSSLAARLVLIASTRRCITSVSQLHTRWHKNALVARSPSPL